MAIDAGSVVAALELDTGQFYTKLQQAQSEANMIGNSLHGYGSALEGIGKSLIIGVTAPITAAGAGIVKTSMKFEAAMSKVQAISGASAADMTLLSDKAKEMGATTKFSASESAEALSYMAMAGWKTRDMLDGLPGIMNLAAASGEALGTVSDIVTDALSAFKLQAEDSGHFADVLAQAASNANTNVSMLGESFKYVAPVAGSLGYSIEDTSLALGLMANSGIKASQAGTSLRGALLRLANPSEDAKKILDDVGISMFNIDGSARPLRDVLNDLRHHFYTLSEEQKTFTAETLFGKNAIAGMLAVLNTADDDYEKFTNALDTANGTAEKMAKTMEDNVKGQMTLLKSNLEGVAIKLGDVLLPKVNEGIVKVNGLVTAFSELSPATQGTIVGIAGIAAAAGPTLLIGGKLLSGLGGLAEALGTTTLAMAPWIAGITAAGAAVYGLATYLSEEAIPTLDLYQEGISNSTAQAVTSFMNMRTEIESQLNYLSLSGVTVTTEMVDSIIAKYDEMAGETVEKLRAQAKDSMKIYTDFVKNMTDKSEDEKQALIQAAQSGWDERIKIAESEQNEIRSILEKAAEEKRGITEAEVKEITEIIENASKNTIEITAASAKEQERIYDELKKQSTRLSFEKASEIIKHSAEEKEKVIAEAESEYEGTIAAIENMKVDGIAFTEEMKKDMIEHAKQMKEATIKEAEELHAKVAQEAKEQANDVHDYISSRDGDIMSNWERLKNWFANNPITRFFKDTFSVENRYANVREVVSDGNRGHKTKPKDSTRRDRRYAAGTNYAEQGIALVGEHGPEFVYLQRGSKVLNASETSHAQKSNVSIVNNYDLSGVTVRSESDIDKIVDEIERRQIRDLRGRGVLV